VLAEEELQDRQREIPEMLVNGEAEAAVLRHPQVQPLEIMPERSAMA
jgi:hypothetical protein